MIRQFQKENLNSEFGPYLVVGQLGSKAASKKFSEPCQDETISKLLTLFQYLPRVFQLSVQNTGSTALEQHTQSSVAASAFGAYYKLKVVHTEGKRIKLSSSAQRFGKEHYK